MKHAKTPIKPPKDELSRLLLPWYDRVKRDMPWRKTTDPYAIWLSETMLQQTQVETVKPYYHKFLAKFPKVQDLASAPLQEVLTLWAGLGYYRRARNLHAAAQAIVANHGGIIPQTITELQGLSGVGRYTAGAVASIAYGVQAAVLDGNVIRVLSRVFDVQEDVSKPATVKNLWEIAESLVPEDRPGDYNQSMMELGATVCVPRDPKCMFCPLAEICQARQRGVQEQRPVKSAKKLPRVVQNLVVVLKDVKGRVLLVQRPAELKWGELWEFPTFLDVANLNSLTHLADTFHKQLGLLGVLDDWQGQLSHQLTHRTMQYTIVRGTVQKAGKVRLPACENGPCYLAHQWVLPQELSQLAVGRVTQKIAEKAGLTS